MKYLQYRPQCWKSMWGAGSGSVGRGRPWQELETMNLCLLKKKKKGKKVRHLVLYLIQWRARPTTAVVLGHTSHGQGFGIGRGILWSKIQSWFWTANSASAIIHFSWGIIGVPVPTLCKYKELFQTGHNCTGRIFFSVIIKNNSTWTLHFYFVNES